MKGTILFPYKMKVEKTTVTPKENLVETSSHQARNPLHAAKSELKLNVTLCRNPIKLSAVQISSPLDSGSVVDKFNKYVVVFS